MKAGIVALRNFFPIVHFNVWLTLAAWAWFDSKQVGTPTIVLADGVTTVVSLVLETLSRLAVYPWRNLFSSSGHRSLPAWSVVLTLISYLIGIGELGLWVLATFMKILPDSIASYAFLGALGAAIIIRGLHNVLLFFNFPSLRSQGGHHKYRSTSCSMLNRLFWKMAVFITVCAGMLVPLFYWFVVPTLQRSAFWVFCKTSSTLVGTLQCYIGIIGLWIPLISVILIMNFIVYAVTMSFYGAYLAYSNDIGLNSSDEAALSVISGFRVFSNLIKRWSFKCGIDGSLSASDMSSTLSSSASSSAPSVPSAVSLVDSASSKSKKRKKSRSSKDAVTQRADRSVDADESSISSEETKVKKSKKRDTFIPIPVSPTADESEFTSMMGIWFLIVDDLLSMDLISQNDAKALYVALNWQEVPIGKRPKEIIQFFFASLGSFSPALLDSLPESYLHSLPPLTQLIPSYGEAVVFDISYLCNRDKKPVSNIEFLVLKYPKEWEFFFQRVSRAYGGPSIPCFGTAVAMAARSTSASSQHLMNTQPSAYSFPSSSNELLAWFLSCCSSTPSPNPLHPDLVDEIRLWASFRGQTLYKTIRGALSYRMALSALYEATGYSSKANEKCQVILAHQQYGDPSMLRQVANDILLLYKRLSGPHFGGKSLFGDTPFDLVFDWSPRDLQAQDTLRKRLMCSYPKGEQVRRYSLTEMLRETERTCSFGEALKQLVDAKAGDCPIDPKSGFPFASVLAGLSTAVRIPSKTSLFKYKGRQVRDALADGGPSSLSSDLSATGSDDEDVSSRDSSSVSSRSRKKPENFSWEHLGSGDAVIHTATDSQPVWLRFCNSDTGREFDFLLRSSFCEVAEVSFVHIPARSLVPRSAGDMLDSSSSVHAGNFSAPYDRHHRSYAVIRFGIRSSNLPDAPAKSEAFALVTCLNADEFPGILDQDSKAIHASVVAGAASVAEREEMTLSQMDAQLALEVRYLQRALTKGNFFNEQPPLSTLGQNILAATMSFKSVALTRSTESSLSQDSQDPVEEAMFLGIDVKAVLPRRNPLLMRVAGEMPFSDPDRIQGKAANQMNGLRFAFGLIIQTKDANQGGNVAEALKFPLVLAKFELHNCRDHHDQLKCIRHWVKSNVPEDSEEKLNVIKHSILGAPRNDGFLPASEGLSASNVFESQEERDRFVEVVERSVGFDDEYERGSKNVLNPPAIIGFREAIFTRGHGAIARFQSYAEWAFGTIVQRVLAKLGLRMHYGHPDFFSGAWVFSRSSISKANPVYNLSEDIFAGYTALLNSRRSVHTDKIQDEKGRDTSLGSTYTFNAKLAQGAASQMKSRDVFWLNSRLDFMRAFLLFHTSLGYYFTTSAMLSSVKMYLFGLLVFSLAGYSAENLGNLQFIYSVPFLVQVGMFTILPLILEIGVEEGIWSLLKVVFDLPLSLGYFLFQGQTTTHHLVESFTKGKSHYEATGRLLGLSRKSLIDSYQLYGRSHLEPSLDYLYYVVVYYIVSSSRFGGYLPLFAPIICVVVFIIAPTGFQLGFSLREIFNDIGDFGRWIFSTKSFSSLLEEWRTGPMREQMVKNLTWKATFKASHSRLQTYSIFNNLKGIISTHWRVDFAAAVTQLFRVIIWGFIIVSIPGSMKDSVLKVLIAFVLYLLLAIALGTTTPKSSEKRKGCWRSFSNLFFVFTVAYFIAMFVILSAWRYIGDCAIGIFLAVKFLKSLSWTIFHFYALFCKISTALRWKSAEKAAKTTEEKDNLASETKKLKANLERRMIGGLYLVEMVDRPILMISISVVLIPIHAVWSILWTIPFFSDWLMYSIPLRPKVNVDELSKAHQPPHWASVFGASGFNTFAGPDDFSELPLIEFDDDSSWY